MSDIRREIVSLLPRLRRLAWVIVRDAQDCEDLLQLTIERALARAGEREAGTQLDLWMFRVMKNLWIDEIRKRRRWGRLVEPLPDDMEIGDRGEGAGDLLDNVELAKVRALVEDLPEEQRMAVKLVLLGGYSYAEAAAVLEIPEGTLTSRLARGRTALLQHYNGKGTRH